jgi:hypothetical protein
MRKKQHSNTGVARPHTGRIWPVCALLVLGGCGGPKPSDNPATPKPSPITVADGSMKIRTKSHSKLTPNTLTIDGGTACSITDPNANQTITLGSSWTITSSDGNATILTTDGSTIVASVTDMSALTDDGTNGGGAEFGKSAVMFSPASLSNTVNGTTTTTPINCTPKACTISYKASCP